MANLIVRNISEDIVKALKARAGARGNSAEAEHHRILEEALVKPRRKSFAEVLMEVPEVGEDADFEREEDNGDRDVFD